MGTQQVDRKLKSSQYREFMKSLLKDVSALEKMLDDGLIESGVRRIGAEQEMFIVDRAWRPAARSQDVLDRLEGPDFTPELAQFNLEFGTDPLSFGGRCLSQLEAQVSGHIDAVRQAAEECGLEVLITGILPTLTLSDLSLDNMTRKQRYFALNEALKKMRGRDYEFRIRGTDEILINHDSVMPEACNTSFQVHFQVGPEEFARLYNIAQAVTAPVLSVATNSPLLFGKRLWRETRIALFQQAVDTRSTKHQERTPRVSFGRDWVKESVLEIFQEDISRFRVLLGSAVDEDPFDALEKGEIPGLQALCLHNGTIYRWNRVCYGVGNGKPHLRIENRVLPAGPTVPDEVANAAFWFGLMSGCMTHYNDVTKMLDFDDVGTNFVSAARLGMGAHFNWEGGKPWAATDLLKQELVPLAREGLKASQIDSADIDRYMGILEERIESGRSGSQWMLASLQNMRSLGTKFERLCALTAATVDRQRSGVPVHKWGLAKLEESGGWKQHFQRVEQFMTTDVYTVNTEDLIDLVANMMEWKNLSYVIVEDHEHNVVGLTSARTMMKVLGQDLARHRRSPTPVRDIMHRDPITVDPATSTTEAIKLMLDNKIGCLPVVKEGGLVGLVTEHHFVRLTSHLLERVFRE